MNALLIAVVVLGAGLSEAESKFLYVAKEKMAAWRKAAEGAEENKETARSKEIGAAQAGKVNPKQRQPVLRKVVKGEATYTFQNEGVRATEIERLEKLPAENKPADRPILLPKKMKPGDFGYFTGGNRALSNVKSQPLDKESVLITGTAQITDGTRYKDDGKFSAALVGVSPTDKDPASHPYAVVGQIKVGGATVPRLVRIDEN